MSNPIRANGKPKSSMQIDNAPTPHNTPASVLNNSYLKNGNPVASKNIPQTIAEEDNSQAAQVASALLAQKPLLLASIQDKLDDLIGADSGYVESLPIDVKNRVYSLSSLQTELFDLEKNFQVEMFELEDKYNKLYRPLMERRHAISSGSVEPTSEEIAKGRELAGEEDEEEEEGEAGAEDEEKIEGIPSFWLTALENLPIVSETITDRDAEVLEYLTDVSMEYISEGQPGFKLVFMFDDAENPYFTNKTLTKTYYYQSELGYSGDFVYDHAEGETITWKDHAHNVTVDVEQRKQRNKATKQVRTVERMTPVESFFNFFEPPVAPTEKNEETEAEEDEEDEEDVDEELESRLALDYSIGEQLKDKLIPRAVDWFTGAALEFEFVEDQDEYDEGEEEDEEEYDDGEGEGEGDNDDQDDFAGTEQAPECKQS
ncbi:similar to Saccharomyces cerevisiae YKR048C NAP1 Protein that interacts with mitotic cyclin Clb2p [Maudiozyma barnettii]|uniref:Similar to Saccharomyces cerevisiae YKR048C NAP1 Protein that interacts with mitotic cyclin Clb2p n=1 Tax=Maudiozyma barnettii TaxID=61262 RepID=A0A8H2VFE2_9SACH|nr:histone chaperone NAP1 [Kazachstania barnettii]CAB4254599.1 similar to Saccharomyces cerevisiae YKR048C NAP1 Protein that interacts with mitotic cyclin Clb2p [Kazachstania barnettii]CAD1782641.1 similar to Saccharomyces cerevisiae YKR048C NAP1 Protein that interacts with mitotic cyclin Clb2p [Kazachstania barnettii]